ncbi:MAG: hypothetical protein FWF10_00455 [Clostridiales bacterium]|nr:hypothetical protein [Clostridiales bacterium]
MEQTPGEIIEELQIEYGAFSEEKLSEEEVQKVKLRKRLPTGVFYNRNEDYYYRKRPQAFTLQEHQLYVSYLTMELTDRIYRMFQIMFGIMIAGIVIGVIASLGQCA